MAATVVRTCDHGCPAYQDSNGMIHNDNNGQCPNNHGGTHNLQRVGMFLFVSSPCSQLNKKLAKSQHTVAFFKKRVFVLFFII